MSPHSTDAPTPPRATRHGFALPMVVFLLFAIGVAAAAGFQIVQTEAKLSSYTRDAGKALSIANSGLRRYLSQADPNVTDTTQYAIDGGNAKVWARRLMRLTFPRETWMITARGTYGDAFAIANESPAERTVRQMVTFRRAPLNVKGVFSNTGTITQTGGTITAVDQATSAQCPDAPRPNILARFAPGSGAPTAQAVLDSLDVPWSTLIDPSFPVDYENTWAPIDIPSTAWPIVRFNGNLDVATVASTWSIVRRGILIVPGTLTMRSRFIWEGIILAGNLASPVGHVDMSIDGLVVGGLAGTPVNVTYTAGRIRFHSCKILSAGKKAALFQTRARTWTEVF
jgi:Tfp pilus assembly protein PilX